MQYIIFPVSMITKGLTMACSYSRNTQPCKNW